MSLESLFTSQTPSVGNASDAAPGITRGMTIQFSTAGNVNSIRWWCPSTNGGTYTVALWELIDNTSGTLKASKTHVGTPTADAWNTTALDTPFAIDTSKAYRVGVHNDQGRYVATLAFFVTPLVNGNLVAEANNASAAGITIGQGVFDIGASLAFPGTGGSGANYFVDVVFDNSPATESHATTGTAGVGVAATASTSAHQTASTGTSAGWYGLLAIDQENRQYAREERINPPMACPNDGEPLMLDPHGKLRCPFDGWIWKGMNV